jgi:hypothetical protein
MSQFDGHFQLGDLRKFAEQHGDIIQWEQSNRAYVLTHGVSGVDWRYYKHPLPDSAYDHIYEILGESEVENISGSSDASELLMWLVEPDGSYARSVHYLEPQ